MHYFEILFLLKAKFLFFIFQICPSGLSLSILVLTSRYIVFIVEFHWFNQVSKYHIHSIQDTFYDIVHALLYCGYSYCSRIILILDKHFLFKSFPTFLHSLCKILENFCVILAEVYQSLKHLVSFFLITMDGT